ncbi:GerMN domain-containing protein [Priestia koreensis]|uniref:Sporulation protein n=1 Tax=Priestia koreensis TaxID=284581 RepID=A0A0M0L8E0_9BACI|nr:GerMN domain-containing protein [Priestia koreensis]KOO46923.1 sporulation protein [Priestia koreensis]
MSKKAKTAVVSTVVVSTVLLSGCGLFGGDKAVEQIDPPKKVSYVEKEQSLKTDAAKETKKDEKASKETIKQELYLLDKNGYVVPKTFELPKTQSVAAQSLKYLVKDGPVTDKLPNGFQAVLPADTEVLGVKPEGKDTLIADFSPEFKNYKKEDERKILEAITYTLTQFEGIKNVKIRINGYDQKVMPVNHTPIGEGVSRADGINLDNSDIADLTNTHAVTVYYLAGEGKKLYYVPVTKRIPNGDENKFTAVVDELIKGPSMTSGLLSDFNSDAKLLKVPTMENGKLTLDFNKSILGNMKGTKISQHVLDALVLSLTEQPDVKSVQVMVNGKANILDEKGKELTKPVTRPEKVNTGSF